MILTRAASLYLPMLITGVATGLFHFHLMARGRVHRKKKSQSAKNIET
jgi:hypothetical protein